MKILIEESVLRLALEAFEKMPFQNSEMVSNAASVLRAAIDEMEKVEPAIWRIDTHDAFWFQDQPDDSERKDITSTPLFAHPDNSELRAAIAEMEKVEPDVEYNVNMTVGNHVMERHPFAEGHYHLYLHPAPDVEQDAKRYRWLVENTDIGGRFNDVYMGWDGFSPFDAAIDAAMKETP